MNVSRTSLLLLPLLLSVIASVAYAATLSDQYDERHDHAATATRVSDRFAPKETSERQEATDHRPPREKADNFPIQSINDHLAKLQVKDASPKDNQQADKNEFGEMQVGCAQGLFDVRLPPPFVQKSEQKRLIRKRAVDEFQRKRRNYQSTFTVWQPPVYTLTRPYVIPVWGTPGRLPVYFPPQPLLVHHPTSDPRKSYLPPKGYLPPDHRTTTIGYDDDEDDSTPPLINRKLDPDDDAPIWDVEPIVQQLPPQRPTQRPAFGIPTRRSRTRTTTAPPLVHRSENNTSNQRPNSLRPLQDRPTIIQVPSGPSNSFGSFRPTQRPPIFRTTPPPTEQPARSQPSRCVWAIISCCTGNSQNISYNCFEQLGCVGAFWDQNPCDSDFAKAAIDVALQYYSQK